MSPVMTISTSTASIDPDLISGVIVLSEEHESAGSFVFGDPSLDVTVVPIYEISDTDEEDQVDLREAISAETRMRMEGPVSWERIKDEFGL